MSALDFRAAFVVCGSVPLGIANRILRLANGCFNFALDLLSGASNFSSSVAGQVTGFPFCASHHFVDCAFDSVLVHLFTS
jgi:hypothetical protein